MNREGAIKATRQGAIAGVCVCTITLILFIIGYLGNYSEDILGYYNDPLILIDLSAALLFTFGIYKRSRAASISMVVLYLVSQVFFYFEGFSLGPITDITSTIVALIILWFFVKAVQGTIVFHRIEKAENPNYKKTSKIWYYVGIPIGAIFMGLVALGGAITVGYLPDTFVQSGDEISEFAYSSLIDAQIISEVDKVKYIYVDGMSWAESGQLLTQDSLVLYYPDDDGSLEVFVMPYESITKVSLEQMGDGWLSDSVYSFESFDTNGTFLLSTEDGGDAKFIAELNRMTDSN